MAKDHNNLVSDSSSFDPTEKKGEGSTHDGGGYLQVRDGDDIALKGQRQPNLVIGHRHLEDRVGPRIIWPTHSASWRDGEHTGG